MHCRVIEVKITENKLSFKAKKHLGMLFVEGKWLKNAVIGSDDIFEFDRDAKAVDVKVGDVFETRELKHLGSQMKQDVIDGVKQDIRNLAALKEKGHKVGALKFKSYCNMIPLRQYGTTFRIDFKNNTISIQGLRRPLKVRGLNQIEASMEIANAKLVQRPSGYYIMITTYSKPVACEYDTAIGTDMGIKTNITTSEGDKYNIMVAETPAVKKASRTTNRSYIKNGKVKSKNHYKRVKKQGIAYEKQTNKKKDLANKAVNKLLSTNIHVAIQDELIAGWHKGIFGKQVQHSCMGLIKAKLKNSSKVHTVKASYPSTQICPECNQNTPHPLSKRDYECKHCGYYHLDRDVKAASTILKASFDPANLVPKGKKTA
jgi:putative transposase